VLSSAVCVEPGAADCTLVTLKPVPGTSVARGTPIADEACGVSSEKSTIELIVTPGTVDTDPRPPESVTCPVATTVPPRLP
jgi:hypothetical protein